MKSALIVEDDDGVIASLSATLIGYAKRPAHTMTEAIKALKEHEFDVLFLDLDLPDSKPTRTLEMIPMIRMLAKDSAIILMTGFPDKIGNAQHAVDSLLLKPFHSGHIREALSDANLAIERHRCANEPSSPMCRAIMALPASA
jgi:ActR/RegA family two-component response regulator